MVGSVKMQRGVAVGAGGAWLVTGGLVLVRGLEAQGTPPAPWIYPLMVLASAAGVALSVTAVLLWVLPSMFAAWAEGVRVGREVEDPDGWPRLPEQQTRDSRRAARLHSV